MATGGAGTTTTSPQAFPHHPSHRGAPAPTPATAVGPASPPSKPELASWWKKFRKQEKANDKVDLAPGIFGVPLAESIRYANVAISLSNEQGESFIYGYVPIVVAKCGVFLKEKATDVEGIFRLSGSAKRIKDLQTVFNSPDRFGKGLDWTGYTVHDAANILRRYLNQLPEPIVPLDFYERFRAPLRSFQARPTENGETQTSDMSVDQHHTAVVAYQKLITELPPLNRQLLLYILDLLAVFASKSDLNRMTAANLAAIFQPGIISHPNHDMAPNEYRLSQDVLIFLIENQDNFLIGMTGTGVDDVTKAEVESGAPSVRSPKSNIGRSASNASGGADSLRRYGVRRNVSVSSHNSRERGSPGVSSPGTPTGNSQLQPPPASGGIARSNTVPSKRSPAVAAARFQRMQETSPVASPVMPSPGPGVETSNASLEAAQILQAQSRHPTSAQPPAPLETSPVQPPVPASINVASTAPQPNRERKISNLFSRSPVFAPTDAGRPQRKLQKRTRIPGSANESAENSQASLHGEDASNSVFHTPLVSPELNSNVRSDPIANQVLTSTVTAATPVAETARTPTSAERLNHTSQPQPAHLQPPRSPVPSVHSRSSVTDHSEFDQLDAPTSAPAGGEKKKSRWRFSSSAKRSDDFPLAPPPLIGANAGARGSNSSIGSSGFGRSEGRPRKSFTNENQATTQDGGASMIGGHSTLGGQSSHENTEALRDTTNRETGEERKGGLLGKWKAKMSERREEKERAKSPPPQGHPGRHGTNNSDGSGKPRASLSAFAQEHFSPGATRRSFDSGSKPRGPGSEGSVHSATGAPAAPTQSGPGELETVKERPLSEATLAAKPKDEVLAPSEQVGVTTKDEVDGMTGLGIRHDERGVPADPAAAIVMPSEGVKEQETTEEADQVGGVA